LAAPASGMPVARLGDEQVLQALTAGLLSGELVLDESTAFIEKGGGGGGVGGAALMAAAAAAGAALGAAAAAAILASPRDEVQPDVVAAPPEPHPCGVKLWCKDLGPEIKQGSTGRKADKKSRMLEVVASNAGANLTLSSVGSVCGRSPAWSVASGAFTEEKPGANAAFRADGWTVGTLPKQLVAAGMSPPMPPAGPSVWAGNATPIQYEFSVGTPCGYRSDFHYLRVYPNDKFSVTFNATDWAEGPARHIKYAQEVVLKAFLKDVDFDGPSGKITISAGWEEDKDTHLAFYAWNVSVGFDPLFGGHCRVPFGPSAVIPQWLKSYGDAYLFVEFNGGIGITGECSRKGQSKVTSGIKATGALSGKIGGSVFLATPDVVGMEVAGSTGITFEVAGDDTSFESPAITLEGKWDGLKANVTVVLWYGVVEFKREATFCDEQVFLEKQPIPLPIDNWLA
ncbi:MAG: hypothetical protein ACKVQR_16200, partial [Aquabacterium sp.]